MQMRVRIKDGVNIDSEMEYTKHIVCVTVSLADFSWYVMINMMLYWTDLSVYCTGRCVVQTEPGGSHWILCHRKSRGGEGIVLHKTIAFGTGTLCQRSGSMQMIVHHLGGVNFNSSIAARRNCGGGRRESETLPKWSSNYQESSSSVLGLSHESRYD